MPEKIQDNKWRVSFNRFYEGFAPAYFKNSLSEVGNRGQANAMTNIDILDPNVLTQGPGLAALTAGTQAGAVTDLVKHILDKAVTTNKTYAISSTLLHELSATAVTNTGSFPHTITGATDGQSVALLKSNLYYFYNKSSGGDIGKFDLSSTFDDDWGCYTEDTEVFTLDGWKLIKDVKAGEPVYSLNPKTQRVEVAINNETINKPYSGKMISFKNEGVDLSVTPDHKMYAGLRKMKSRQTFVDWQVVRADSLLNKTSIKLKKNAIWGGKVVEEWTVPEYDNGSRQDIVRDSRGRIVSTSGKRYYRPARNFPIKPFLRLLGFYISEGSSNQKCISIAQKTYSKGWQPIKDTLDELGVNYGYYRDSFDIHDKQLTQHIKSLVPGLAHEKRVPKEILELHPSLLMELYEALMLGDGYLGTNQYYTVSEGLKDDFIELVNRLGWSTSLFIRDNVGERAFKGTARYICYTIGVIKDKNETTLNHHKTSGGRVSKENYQGNIVCLALDKNHIMLVRRNDKSVWCGNSTVPTGAAALQKAPHPVATKEDIMVFGNGRYCGVYTEGTNTLVPDRLDFGQNSEVADVVFSSNSWLIAVNSPNLTGSNRSEGNIFLYDGSATTSILDDETGVGLQRIGFLKVVDGIVFLAYQDLTSTGGYKIGYISGRSVKPLGHFTGSLPLFYQKTLFENTILFLSGQKIFSNGAITEDFPIQTSQIASARYATAGAIAAPFGEVMVASTASTNFSLDKFSNYTTTSNWTSLVERVSQQRYVSVIDEMIVWTEAFDSGGRVDITVQANHNSINSGAKTVSTADTRRHVLDVNMTGAIEDFRLYVDFSNGSTTIPVKIRAIEVLGHYKKL